MAVRRNAAAEDRQGLVSRVLEAVAGPRRNPDRIPGGDGKTFIPENHPPLAGGDMVDLLGEPVAVRPGFPAGRDHRLGQALSPVAVDRRVHQLPDERAVKGGIRMNLVSDGPDRHAQPTRRSASRTMASRAASFISSPPGPFRTVSSFRRVPDPPISPKR